MNTDEWVHYTVHKALKEKCEKSERNADRDRNAFFMMCEALEKIESAVGIDTGGWNGPGPAVDAVQELVKQRDMVRNALDSMLEDGGWVCGDWYPSESACEKARTALAETDSDPN